MAYIVFNVPKSEREEFLRTLNKWEKYSPRLVNKNHEVKGNVMIEAFGLEGFGETAIAVEFINIGESKIRHIIEPIEG